MADKTTTLRILADFDAKTDKFKKSFDDLKQDFAAFSTLSKGVAFDADKALNTIGLGAQNQVPGLQRLHDGFQAFTGKIGAGIVAVDKFAKALGPWNQALELGNKVVDFASAGMDAYAKTSVQAAKEVGALKKEFEGYRDSVMQSVGALAVELLKPAVSFEEQAKSLLKISNSPAFKILYGDKGVLRGGAAGLKREDFTEEQLAIAKRYGIEFNEAKDPIDGVARAFGGVKDALKEGVDYWNTDGQTFVDGLADGMAKTKKQTEQAAAAAKRAAEEYARWKAEYSEYMAAARRNEGRNYTDAAGPRPDFSAAGLGSTSPDVAGNASINGAMDSFYRQKALGSAGDRYAESAGRRNDSFLEQHFGKIEDFDAYATAFGTLTGATQSAMQAWISGSLSIGKAIKKGLGDALGGLASSLAVESLKHGAYALGSLAFLDFGGAARHGAAAAAFGVGAAAAAVTARKLGGSVSGATSAPTAGAGGGGAGAGAGAPSGGGGGGGQGGGTVIRQYNIVYGETFYQEAGRMRQLDAERFVKRAVGNSYVEHS